MKKDTIKTVSEILNECFKTHFSNAKIMLNAELKQKPFIKLNKNGFNAYICLN